MIIHIHVFKFKTQQYICMHMQQKLNYKVHTKQHKTQATHKQTFVCWCQCSNSGTWEPLYCLFGLHWCTTSLFLTCRRAGTQTTQSTKSLSWLWRILVSECWWKWAGKRVKASAVMDRASRLLSTSENLSSCLLFFEATVVITITLIMLHSFLCHDIHLTPNKPLLVFCIIIPFLEFRPLCNTYSKLYIQMYSKT